MADLKTIGIIVAIVTGGGGPVVGHLVSAARVDEKVQTIEKWEAERRTELDSMHVRENSMEQGITAARNDVSLARSDITGKINEILVRLAAVKDTLDEVRDVQHKHPSSLNGNGTSQ